MSSFFLFHKQMEAILYYPLTYMGRDYPFFLHVLQAPAERYLCCTG